jgi:hypothetical protein
MTWSYGIFKQAMLTDALPKLPRYCQECGGRIGTTVDHLEGTESVDVVRKCEKCGRLVMSCCIHSPLELVDYA